jgi:hypothetical protein
MKKDEWESQLPNGCNIHYSIEPNADPLWTITAQAQGSVILHQNNVKGPTGRQQVEAHFRDDLMKELPGGQG